MINEKIKKTFLNHYRNFPRLIRLRFEDRIGRMRGLYSFEYKGFLPDDNYITVIYETNEDFDEVNRWKKAVKTITFKWEEL